MAKKIKEKVLLIGIILIAAFLRFAGTNWDDGTHLHPDERFLTMVTTAIRWPSSIGQYFDQATSPLNPANANFPFFVYGTLPIFIVKAVADWVNQANYTGITLVGRNLSALFDLGTLLLVFKSAQKMAKERYFPYLAAFFYAASVLPIQLSHFFAVDTFLVFFVTACFYLLVVIVEQHKPRFRHLLPIISLLGIAFGLALACKISAVLFAPIIAIGLLYALIRSNNSIGRRLFHTIITAGTILVFAYVAFRSGNPYAFKTGNWLDISINPLFVNNLQTLQSSADPNSSFPPSIQWTTTTPMLQLHTFLYYGVGLPLGVVTIIALAFIGWRVLIGTLHEHIVQNRTVFLMALASVWIIGLFVFQSHQFAKPLRYLAPLYPFVALVAGYFSSQFLTKKTVGKIVIGTVVPLTLIWSWMFASMYTRTNSRVAASEWMYAHIPAGATLTCEHWDDCMPLNVNGQSGSGAGYRFLEMPMFGPDNLEKWQLINQNLAQTDYLVLSSNRVYGSLMTVPARFPQTSTFYQQLFDGKLGFAKVAEFTSRPNLPIPLIHWCITLPLETYGAVAKKDQECDLPGISLVDDYTEESWTVYDHPKVIIFKKVR